MLCYLLLISFSEVYVGQGHTWFAGGDSGPWRGRPGACAVVRKNSDVVSSAGPQAWHSGSWFQAGSPHSVCGRFPLMLSPVSDLRTKETQETSVMEELCAETDHLSFNTFSASWVRLISAFTALIWAKFLFRAGRLKLIKCTKQEINLLL